LTTISVTGTPWLVSSAMSPLLSATLIVAGTETTTKKDVGLECGFQLGHFNTNFSDFRIAHWQRALIASLLYSQSEPAATMPIPNALIRAWACPKTFQGIVAMPRDAECGDQPVGTVLETGHEECLSRTTAYWYSPLPVWTVKPRVKWRSARMCNSIRWELLQIFTMNKLWKRLRFQLWIRIWQSQRTTKIPLDAKSMARSCRIIGSRQMDCCP
jgi:hypothetical protein